MALNRLGITAHMILHTPLAIKRFKEGISQVRYADNTGDKLETVAVFLIEIDRQSSNKDIKELAKEIESVLGDVSASVSDWGRCQTS